MGVKVKGSKNGKEDILVYFFKMERINLHVKREISDAMLGWMVSDAVLGYVQIVLIACT